MENVRGRKRQGGGMSYSPTWGTGPVSASRWLSSPTNSCRLTRRRAPWRATHELMVPVYHLHASVQATHSQKQIVYAIRRRFGRELLRSNTTLKSSCLLPDESAIAVALVRAQQLHNDKTVLSNFQAIIITDEEKQFNVSRQLKLIDAKIMLIVANCQSHKT